MKPKKSKLDDPRWREKRASKAGKASWKSKTPEERSARASAAANARWSDEWDRVGKALARARSGNP
jgi:hypothetical protein